MVGLETPSSRLASPTVATPPLSRSTSSRRIGWASAVNVSLAITLTILCRPEATKEDPDDRTRGGNARAMAVRPPGAARRREGARAPGRRARPPAPGAAVGADRAGVHLRDGRGDEDAGRPLRRPLTAACLPLHVRRRVPRRRAEPGLHR